MATTPAGDDDIWAVFGESDATPVAAVAPRAAGVKRPLDLAAALEPFLDAHGAEPVVPPPPPPPPPREASRASEALAIWPAYPPHSTGPIALATELGGIGGCRGFVAARDVQPGEVLMAEEPLLRWPSEERRALPLLRSLLTSSEWSAHLHAVARLHPERLESVPPTGALPRPSWRAL
jgi:hypothetical protein